VISVNFDPGIFIEEIDSQYGKLNVSDMEKHILETVGKAAGKYGEDSTGFAALLNELGGFYRSTSQYKKAEEAFVKALLIIGKTSGRQNPNYATTLNNLAGVFRMEGDYAKAEQMFLEATELYKSASLEGSPAYASALNNLGLLYLETKDYGKAAVLFGEANAIVKKEGDDPAVYATGLGNLAASYIGLGWSSEAGKLLAEAVDVYRNSGLESNFHYPSALSTLGLFHFSAGEYAEAEKLFLQALELREKEFGRNNHEFAKACDNLSVLYEKTGDFSRAERFARQSLESHLSIFGAGHPSCKKSAEALERLQNRLNKGSASGKTAGTTGMELAFMTFMQFSAETLCRKFPEYGGRIAAGLVGEGSECYGFDDEISRDHDWGPSFCIWLEKEDFEKVGSEMQKEYEKLCRNFLGFETRNESTYSSGRRGVMETGGFYKKYIGLDRPPANLREWRAIPETNLSVVTNGKVFLDSLGKFSSFRSELKAYYPEDVRLKKLAARCAVMAQAGQYNYPRCIKRSEQVAAQQAMAGFIDAAVSAVFLLNREYKPFYKWMHRAMKGLPVLGPELHNRLSELVSECQPEKRIGIIEDISQRVIAELKSRGMSRSGSGFLLEHAQELQAGIKDQETRQLHVMAD
jgi:tetratricopeptide (TPR) repeat protein